MKIRSTSSSGVTQGVASSLWVQVPYLEVKVYEEPGFEVAQLQPSTRNPTIGLLGTSDPA